MNIRCLLCFLILLLPGETFAQILDDSTKEIYGSHSTRYFLQEDVFLNKDSRSLDTSIHNLHQYNYQFTDNIWYQNLGNMGTAMKPVYFQTPTEIGYRLGFESFLPYLNKPEAQRYFDTKSPYSELNFTQGTTGEQRLYLLLTRNVNQYWNLGASYNRFTSVKQLAPITNRDFQTDHHQINIFSSIRSKKSKYLALVSFNYMQHWTYESGGVSPEYNPTINDSGMYLYKYANVRLLRNNVTAARNYYKYTNLHIYQQFNLLDSGVTFLNLFHEGDWKRETQYFRDNNMRVDNAFINYYGGVNFRDSSMTFYRENFELFQNKLGLKGKISTVDYSLYYKDRQYSRLDTSQNPNTVNKSKTWFHDGFVGGNITFLSKQGFLVSFSGEGMVDLNTNKPNTDTLYKGYDDYKVSLNAKYKGFTLSVNQIRSSPTLFQTMFVNNLSNWAYHKDSLDAVLYRNATLSYNFKKSNYYINTGIHYQRIDNLIYLRQVNSGLDSGKIRPVQDSAYIDYVQPFINFRYNWRRFFIEGDLRFTNVFTDREIIHMPRWSAIPRIYYQNKIFNKSVEIQTGIEVLLKSNYYADAYAPQLNSFYWQDQFQVKMFGDYTFPNTNVFLNFQISRARIFLRVSNIFGDQNLQTGYIETPYYPGMKRSFQFGVLWRAFN